MVSYPFLHNRELPKALRVGLKRFFRWANAAARRQKDSTQQQCAANRCVANQRALFLAKNRGGGGCDAAHVRFACKTAANGPGRRRALLVEVAANLLYSAG